ncbi:EF-hand domain-containing protein [Lentzea sp. CC55]|uniref:EF-hand domain-containing protein n=1 Tax=Lentzea sp. CC55 TaxID=2884909 RepID=UPI001F23BDAA|nr:EF-hand domain-containing protein [Lentzea sp. CC55]MCG8927856.1 EF-hand domain-containing protein [Lentzea sp. CC55]
MKITPFLDRRLSHRFSTYDTDQDGHVQRADFELACTRLTSAFGLDAGDERAQRLHEQLLGVWEHLAAMTDVNDDGQISLAEYKSAFVRGLLGRPEAFDDVYVPYLDALLAVADHDGDGRLGLEEHVRWSQAMMDVSEADARAVHARLDHDGDGLIGTEDLLAAWRGYYFSEDPDGPGAWLLGPLP